MSSVNQKRQKMQTITALIVAGLSTLFVGCGNGAPVVPPFGVGAGLGGMVGAGGCSPLPLTGGYAGAYGTALSITFNGGAYQVTSIQLQGGMLPYQGVVSQLGFGVTAGGALAVPPVAGYNSYVGNSADGTLQMSIINNYAGGVYPGMYPGSAAPGMYGPSYGTGYGTGNVQVSGSVVMSPTAVSDLMNQAYLSSGYGTGYGTGYAPMPYSPYPNTGYPYGGTPYGSPYGTPYAAPQACISGIGLDLSIYPGQQRVYNDVYVFLNNTNHGIKLVF